MEFIKKKIPRSLSSFIELLDEPSLIVDRKLDIIYLNRTASILFESEHYEDIKNFLDIPCIKKSLSSEKLKLNHFEFSLKLDTKYYINFKPVRTRGLYFVSLHKINTQKNKTESKLEWNPLAQIVHDMRTPLTALIGFTRLLSETNLSETERQSYLSRAENNLEYLENIISGLLTISKQQNDGIRIEKKIIDTKTYLDGLCEDISLVARNKSLTCHCEIEKNIPQKIAIDPVGVRHVVDNLTGNAIKYTPRGSIEVVFGYSPSNHQLKFRIKDSGIGIEEKNQSHVFAPFFQESRQDKGGVGLGLAIIKSYSQAMGGDAYLIESKKDRGSTFGAHFDCSITGEVQENKISNLSKPAQVMDAQLLKNVNVLVVDDSSDILLLIRKVLSSVGANVMTTESPEKALERLKNEKFDLLVSDMQMPEMSGHTLLQKAREEGFTNPAIALTGIEELNVKAEPYQFACYLTKPFKFDVLCSMAAELTK